MKKKTTVKKSACSMKGHPDKAKDMALIKKMVKPKDLKK